MTRFIPPRQLRSQETLDRILDAAERVLEEKSFSEATLAEIVERAGVTVGAFYRRFPDKDALLHHLDERFFREMHAAADATLDPGRWAGQPASAVIRAVAEEAVAQYRRRRGLLRSLFLRARVDAVIQESARRVNEHLIARLREVLLARREQLSHPDPEFAVAIGFRMFIGALRETIVFDEVWPPEAEPGERLADEMTRWFCAYLGVAEPAAVVAEGRG